MVAELKRFGFKNNLKPEIVDNKIHEMHLIVLTKESKKLDLEMENLLLEREKLQLEIKKFK